MVPIFYQHGQNLRDYWNTNKEKDSLDNDPPIKEVAQDLSRTVGLLRLIVLYILQETLHKKAVIILYIVVCIY